MKTKIKFLLLIISIAFNLLLAQDKMEYTLTYDSLIGSPKATLEDVAWISGYWRGEAFNGEVEEIWSSPLGNSMVASFKLVVDDEVKFYEIEIITEINGTLMLRLKHFHSDLRGWEEKDETVDFPLVKITESRVFFDGMTFEKVSDNEMNVYVLIKQEDKVAEEMKFNYHK
ncbi:MAG: hypothetical protein IH852_04025 [Bacteroidetes bacterium]|nr:hypothetical protein [Bacteroidota bacterium]